MKGRPLVRWSDLFGVQPAGKQEWNRTVRVRTAVLAGDPAWPGWADRDGSGSCVVFGTDSGRERGWQWSVGGCLLDRAALRKLNNWRQLAAIFQILRKVWFCVEQLPQTLKRELLPTVMTEGLILESRCVRLRSLLKMCSLSMRPRWRALGSCLALQDFWISMRYHVWKERALVLKSPASEQLNQSCWSWKIFVLSPWFCFPLTQKPAFVSDSLRDGPCGRKNRDQEWIRNSIWIETILWWGGRGAVRGLCFWSWERIHDWTPRRKVVNHLSVK